MKDRGNLVACVASALGGAALAMLWLSRANRLKERGVTDEEIFDMHKDPSSSRSNSKTANNGNTTNTVATSNQYSALKGSAAMSAAVSIDVGGELPPDIEAEVFSRNVSFFGEEGFRAIRGSFMVVVGLGGVGSHAAHMIARSGVGHLRIIDFDQVTLSSLNRHAVATLADVGRPKAEVLKKHLVAVVPWCDIDARKAMFTAECAETLLEPLQTNKLGSGTAEQPRWPDVVVDCIDDVNTKSDLICFCQARGIPVVTACAAGGKADPTRLHMGRLNDASRDPLAVKMRWKLKKQRCQNLDQVVTVYSSEQPRVKLLPLSEEQLAAPQEFGLVEGFRTRVMPVLGTSPAVMGQAMAAYVLCKCAGQPFLPEPVAPMSIKARHKFAQHLKNRERARFGNRECIVDKEDIEFIVSELWRAKCAATQERSERVAMEITRWRCERGDRLDNYVLLRSHLAKQLDECEGGPEDVFDKAVVDRIDRTLAKFAATGENFRLS